jgi:hypothetical protein
VPRAGRGTGLLAPFDPLIWHRPRTERIFGMQYRLEVYTPADRRRFGYYVLPYLHRGRLVGRVDLKADRAAGRLLVRSGCSQHGLSAIGPPPASFAADLHRDLTMLAEWLGLSAVALADARGDLAAALRVRTGG